MQMLTSITQFRRR